MLGLLIERSWNAGETFVLKRSGTAPRQIATSQGWHRAIGGSAMDRMIGIVCAAPPISASQWLPQQLSATAL